MVPNYGRFDVKEIEKKTKTVQPKGAKQAKQQERMSKFDQVITGKLTQLKSDIKAAVNDEMKTRSKETEELISKLKQENDEMKARSKETEELISKLKQENDDLKKELSMIYKEKQEKSQSKTTSREAKSDKGVDTKGQEFRFPGRVIGDKPQHEWTRKTNPGGSEK